MEKLGSATAVSKKFQQLIAAGPGRPAAPHRSCSRPSRPTSPRRRGREPAGDPRGRRSRARRPSSRRRRPPSAPGRRPARPAPVAARPDRHRAGRAAGRGGAAAAAAAAAAGGGGGAPRRWRRGLWCVLCPFAFGHIPNSFPWGQCTWYVASLREVTWWGNADEWLGNAQAQGYSTGADPQARRHRGLGLGQRLQLLRARRLRGRGRRPERLLRGRGQLRRDPRADRHAVR